ncbi:MAG: DEAD/DEAH box helicase [Candidatus Heimdallarchaeaceae archaeon]
MKCPDCNKSLTIEEKSHTFTFRCQFCGYYSKIVGAKNAEEAYEKAVEKAITQNNTIQISKKESEQLVKRLTLQEKINLIKKGNGDPSNLPNPLVKLLRHPDLEPVYYLFLEQKSPALAKDSLFLPSELSSFLKKKGFVQLYEFQKLSFKKITEGKNVVIVAPTGTGKTEAFLFAILTEIWKSHPHPLLRNGPYAIFIYPNKALARDQQKKISEYSSKLGVTCEIFDGDTSQSKRKKILENPPDILITNPDMLHYHMQKPSFRSLLYPVRFVVIDEVHVAVGAFGTNLYFIIRRLGRLTKNKLQFIAVSATIGNAVEFTSKLFDSPSMDIVEVTDVRKAPTHLMIVYPYGTSQYTLTGDITRLLASSGRKILVFQNSHKNAEIINLLLSQRMKIDSAVHRAGLTKKYRAQVEKRFRDNELNVLVSTPTLELGIDIGSVDSVVSSIVDFTRFTQRLGRAGRKGQESIGVLILRDNDPISTYYAFYPEDYFEDIRKGFIEPKNELIAYYQILSAVMDKPVKEGEFQEFKHIILNLVNDGLVKLVPKGEFQIADYSKARKVLSAFNLRGIGDTIIIEDINGKELGSRSMPMAARELHPGAIYLLGGKYYRSLSFQYDPRLSRGKVKVQNIPPLNKKTTALRFAMPEIIKIHELKKITGTEAIYCDLRITENVIGYSLSDIFTDENVENIPLKEPIQYSFVTKGFMFVMPKPQEIFRKYPDKHEDELVTGTFHAIEHVLIESSEMITGGGSNEIGGISMGNSGAIFVYDGAKGGSGLSKLLFDRLDEALNRSLNILKKCTCKTIDGCPRCTYSYQCGNNNSPLNKYGAIESLSLVRRSKLKIIEDVSGYSPLI